MAFSPLYLKRLQRATEKCDADATYLFPKNKFEVKNVSASLSDTRGLCRVDFKPKDYLIDRYECEDACDIVSGSEYDIEEYERMTGKKFDYDECVEECMQDMEATSWGSMEFYLDNHEIKDATMPIDCSNAEDITYLIYEPDEVPYEKYTEEEWEDVKKRWKPLIDECKLDVASLHIHHFVPGIPHIPLSYHDDPPVLCFIHPKKCKVERALQLVYG